MLESSRKGRDDEGSDVHWIAMENLGASTAARDSPPGYDIVNEATSDERTPSRASLANRSDSSDTDDSEKGRLIGSGDAAPGVPKVALARKLTLFHAVGLLVGTVIGTGIFITPNSVLEKTGSIGASFFVWIACGVISWLGALCFCELATSIPDAGASYAYMYRAYGELPAFLYVWTSGFVIRPSGRAVGALALADYMCRPFYTSVNRTSNATMLNCTHSDDDHLYASEDTFTSEAPPEWMIKVIGVAMLVSLGLINIANVKWMGRVQNVSLVLKLLTILFLITLGLIYIGEGHTENITNFFTGTRITASRLANAFYGGLWTYDSWDTLFFATEEVENAARVIPRALAIGMSTVMVAYMLANLAYMSLLSAHDIMATKIIAVDAARPVIGTSAAIYLMPLLVAISMYGSANGDFFSSSRQAFSAGRQGSYPSFLSAIHKSTQAPVAAVVWQVLLGIAYLIPGEIGPLLHVSIFTEWVFYGSCFAAVIVLRFREPDLYRPYKVFVGIPVVMVLISLYLVVAPFFDQPKQSAYAAATIAVGFPIYFLFVWKKTSPGFLHHISGAFTKLVLIVCCSSRPTGNGHLD